MKRLGLQVGDVNEGFRSGVQGSGLEKTTTRPTTGPRALKKTSLRAKLRKHSMTPNKLANVKVAATSLTRSYKG